MPAGFDRCEKMGGRVRTMSGPNKRMELKKGEYMHVCFDKNGTMHRGYKKMKGSEKEMMKK